MKVVGLCLIIIGSHASSPLLCTGQLEDVMIILIADNFVCNTLLHSIVSNSQNGLT